MSATDLINIGRIVGTHGYKGTMKIEILTDFPERFKPLKSIKVKAASGVKEYTVESTSMQGAQLLMKFQGIESKEEAQLFRGALLCVEEDEIFPLPEGAYYHFQLMGLEVVDASKGSLGKIIDILETGANDVYVVNSPEYGEVLLPAIKQVIIEVDLNAGVMKVELLEGLID